MVEIFDPKWACSPLRWGHEGNGSIILKPDIDCKKKCDLCRMVFDDDIRYFYDQYRESESQNVLCQITESFLLKKEDFKI